MAKSYSASDLNIDDIDNEVKIKKYFQVKTTSIFAPGGKTLDPEGLFSEEGFGVLGSRERFEKWGYIQLNTTILHPYIYEVIKRLYRNIDIVLQGNRPFLVKGDTLAEPTAKDLKNANNKFIYGYDIVTTHYRRFIKFLESRKNLDEISENVKDSIDVLKNVKQNLITINNFLVIPAGFRDINTLSFEKQGVIKYEPINDTYIQLIKLTSYGNPYQVQKVVQELHNYFIRQELSGKTGKIKGFLGKKPINYASRAVISLGSNTKGNHWKNHKGEVSIPVGYIGIPVHILVTLFHPFFIHEITEDLKKNKKYFKELHYKLNKYTGKNDKTVASITNTLLDVLAKDYKFGFKTIGRLDKNNNLQILDWLRKLAYNVVGTVGDPKRFVLVTRYPISNKYSDQFLAPIPYVASKYRVVHGYEVTDDIYHNYSPAYIINPVGLSYQGGDYDGDQLNVIGIFTNEGNKSIKEGAWFRHVNVDSTGSSTAMFIGNEQMFALYLMTK